MSCTEWYRHNPVRSTSRRDRSCTCCRKASIAFATTVCSPAKLVPGISRVSASCSRYHSSRSMPSTLSTPRLRQARSPMSPEHPCPCCRSRMVIIETFLPDNSPMLREVLSTAPRRFRPRSGLTPHDADTAAPYPQRRTSPASALGRQCRCLCRHAGLFRNHIPKTQNRVSKNARGAITPAIRIMLRGIIARAGAALQNSYA